MLNSDTTADVRIFIFEDRVEIINPGNFPEGVTPENPSHNPVNRILSKYMYDIGFIEGYGSGIANVRSMLMKNGNKQQEYSFTPLETKTSVYMQTKMGLKKDLEKVGEKVGENEAKIIESISQNKNITYIELAKKLKITEKSVYMNVEKLKKKGLLKRIGPDKGGYWQVR